MAEGIAFNTYKRKLLEANINHSSDDIKVALLASTYVPNIDTQEFFSDVSAHDLPTLGGYTAGGQSLASKTVTVDNADNEGVFDAADLVWTADGTGFTCRFAVMYKNTGTVSTSPLIAYWDFGSNQNPVSTTFTLVMNAEGIININ